MAKKSAAQLDREIFEALHGKDSRTSGSAKPAETRQQKLSAAQEKFLSLLNQRSAEGREIARDLLLEHGVIRAGRIDSVRTIGNSFSGPIFQVDMAMANSGGQIGGNDPKRFWMVNGNDVPEVGGVIYFMVTDGSPPTGQIIRGKSAAPKKQLHPLPSTGGILGANYPESIIRKWIAKWWALS